MQKPTGQSLLYGTAVLTAGMAAVKLIGALFKIPLTNLLGGVGMSCFNVAYDLYYPFYALFVSGVPVAVSRLVSENAACGRYRDTKKLLRAALILFSLLGLFGCALLFFGAGFFARSVHNPDAFWAVRALSPSLFFGCVMACLRGFWQGLSDMRPTAISQITEAFAKLLFGLLLSYGMFHYCLGQYAQTGLIFGTAYDSLEQAQLAALPYAAAGAIGGVTCSTVCGALCLLFRSRRTKDKTMQTLIQMSPPARSMRLLTKRLVCTALPICAAALIANLTSFIDLLTVINRLENARAAAPDLMYALYGRLMPPGVSMSQLPTYLYGCYSGLAVPLYNLIPALTGAVGISLLPAVSGAWAKGDRRALEKNLSSGLRTAAILAFPAGLGLSAMAEPILRMLYFSKPLEAAVIAPVLKLMGLGAIFVALAQPLSAALQAVGRTDLPVKLMLTGASLKLCCNLLLVGNPQLNIHAAPVGTIICYGFVLSAALYNICSLPGVQLPVLDTLGKPFLCAVGCAVSAKCIYTFFNNKLPDTILLFISIGCAGLIYIILLILGKCIKKEDCLNTPGTEKFIKLLEKHKLLG